MDNGEGLPIGRSLADRVSDLLSRMTLEEKISFLPSRHPPIERLGLGEFWLGGEGAHGVVLRDGGKATVFPQPLGISMTWDKELASRIGECIGKEARVYHNTLGKKGFLVLFFPTIDMERDPRWGRNEEAYGEDPLLAGKLAAELIKGLQGSDSYWLRVAAMPKHFYANNYEFERTWADSVIGEKLRNEYYLRVFAYAFEEGHAKSLMCAYNKVNGNIGLMNPELNSIVRNRWGSDGFFASDGGAFGLAVTEHKFGSYAETAAASLKAGLDAFLDKPELVIKSVTEAVEQGLLTERDIDVSLSRQLSILFRLGAYGGDHNPLGDVPETALCSAEHSQLARRAAREAVVLLKNDGFLPLAKNVGKIAVIGRLGNENLPDWYSGNPPYSVTALDGIRKAFPDSEVLFTDSCDITAFYSE
ncbi:MAG: glycoside hydrolase family 3 C-terminal domain-containing protein, partial [Clostridiales bacterium]|nr:glycoside hydrolase family 3 C-terminal domain-containing protein [Clostridiales bacterium]